MNKLIDMTVGLILIRYIWRKIETMRKLTETCGNEERVSVLLKLYRNLLHQVSAN